MQFLVDVMDASQRPDDNSRITEPFDSFGGASSGSVERLQAGGLQMHFRVAENDADCQLWTEGGRPRLAKSFVYVLGWCYRVGSSSASPTDGDFARMLARHRGGLPPADEEVSGNYLIAVYDSVSGRLAVQPDHDAWSAVYFAATNGRIAISNRAALVASVVQAPLDGYSVFSLLRGTHFPFGRSLFGGVRRVLCGCYLEVDTKRARVELRRAMPLYVPTREISRRDSVAVVCETVSSLARRLTAGEQTVFDLTGGMDTRLLAAGIQRENPAGISDRFTWSIVGPEDLPDVRVAQQVADTLGWPLRRLDRIVPSDADLSELVRDAVMSDGSCSIDLSFARLRHEAQEGGTWGRAGGMGGEILRGWLWSQEFLALGRTSRVNYEALMGYRIRPSRSFEGSVLGSGWPSLAEHDQILLQPYRDIGEAGGDRVNAYKLDVMAQHKLTYLAYYWLAGVRRVRLPFVSWEFCRAVLSLPWRLRATRRLLLLSFAELSPELTRILTSKGEPMTPLSWSTSPVYGKRALSELRRGVPFVLGRVFGGSHRRETEVQPPPRSWVSVLREAKQVTSFVDPQFVRRAWDQENPTMDSLRAFQFLLTLELLCRGLPRLRKEAVFWEVGKLS
jgi:hypothetical protein